MNSKTISEALWDFKADFKQLLQLRADLQDDVALKKIINLYLSTTPDQLQRIEDLSTREEFRKLSMEAHSLKSSASLIRAANVAFVCQMLERCTDKRISLFLLDELQTEHEAFAKQLRIFSEQAGLTAET